MDTSSYDFPSQYSESFAGHTYLVLAQVKRTLYIVFYYIRSFYTDMKNFSSRAKETMYSIDIITEKEKAISLMCFRKDSSFEHFVMT